MKITCSKRCKKVTSSKDYSLDSKYLNKLANAIGIELLSTFEIDSTVDTDGDNIYVTVDDGFGSEEYVITSQDLMILTGNISDDAYSFAEEIFSNL